MLTLRTCAPGSHAKPVVLATTLDEEKALSAGCDGHITKPIDTRTLPGVIAEHLRS